MRCSNSRQMLCLFGVLCLFLTGSTGCAVLYQLTYGDGPMVEAKYKGLEDRKVAVVCNMNSLTYGDRATSSKIARNVERYLRQKVDGIKIVPQQKIGDWIDGSGWDGLRESDFAEIGRGVKAEMVVAIDVDSFSTHESRTLLQGRVEFETAVYDITQEGEEVFRVSDARFVYPETHPIPVIAAEDSHDFERVFLMELAKHIAKNFYDYYLTEDFASDGAAYAQ